MDDGRVSLFVCWMLGGKCSHSAISDTEAEGREGSAKVPSHTCSFTYFPEKCVLSAFISDKKDSSVSRLILCPFVQMCSPCTCVCVNTCLFIQRGHFFGLMYNSLLSLGITLWGNCQFGKPRYREADSPDRRAGRHRRPRSSFLFCPFFLHCVCMGCI